MVGLIHVRLVHRPHRIRGLRPPFSFLGCVVKQLIINIGLFLLLILLGGLVISKPAQAYDGVYWSGWYAPPAGTPEEGCAVFSAGYSTVSEAYSPHNPDAYVCYPYSSSQQDSQCKGPANPRDDCVGDGLQGIGGKRTTIEKKICPDPVPTSNQLLIEACGTQPTSCPDAGEKKRLGYTKTTTPGNYEGGLTITITNGQSQGASIVSGGCGYSRVPSSIPDCKMYAYDSEGRYKWNCYADYQATGEAANPDPASSLEYFDESEDDAPKEADGVKDTRQSSVTKTSTDPVTEMVGDKKVTRKTEITTESRGDGAVIEKQDDITVITESDGITKTETKTTTTTTNPDGSQTIETTNNISYTQHPQVIYNIDNSENKITVSETPGGTTSQTVTTKDTYDAEGNQTGSEQSTGPVQGDDVAKESEEKQTCENNPFMDKCLDDFKKTAKGEFGDISAKITEAKSDFESKWTQIKTEASSKLGFTLNGGGALEQHIVVIRGVEADIGITRWVPYFDEFGLAALIMAGAALYAAIIMFKG